MAQVNEAFVNDDNNSDSGVSGGNGGGSQDDAGSLGHDDEPLVSHSPSHLHNSLNLAAQAQEEAAPEGISGHENPVYGNTGDREGTYGGSDFSSFTSGRRSIEDEELGRQSLPRSADGRDSSLPFEEVRGESAPYEPMVVLPSGAMQLLNAQQISGQRKTNPEAHFRLNPLFNESQQT